MISLMDKLLTQWRRFANFKGFWPIILVVAVMAKGAYFIDARDKDILTLNQLRAMDMEKFLNWSRILADHGRWLSDFSTDDESDKPVERYHCFYQSPLYPYFMAAVYKFTGVDTGFRGRDQTGYHAIILAQQLLGLLLLWPVHELTRRLSGREQARLAVTLLVLCDVMMFFETVLLRAFLLAFLYTWTLHSLLVLRDKPSLGRALAAGVWMGLCWVGKPNFMAIAPLIFIWLACHRPPAVASVGRWWGRLGCVALGLAAVLILPVMRNLELRERAEIAEKASGEWTGHNPVPVMKMTTRGPYSYINGNSFRTSSLMKEINPQLAQDFISPGMGQGIGWDFNTLKQNWYQKKFYNRDSVFARAVLDPNGDNPDWQRQLGTVPGVMKLVLTEHADEGTVWSRFVPMLVNKTWAFVNGYETPNNTNINVARKFSMVMNVMPVGGTLICVLFMMSLVLLAPQWKDPSVQLVVGFVLLFLSITVAFYFISRFRVPVLPLMLVSGCAALPRLGNWWRAGESRRVIAVMVAALSVLLAWPRDVRGGDYQTNYETLKGIRYQDYYNYALGKQEVNDPAGAESITTIGLQQRGALIFPELLRIHYWALVNQPGKDAELASFASRLEAFYTNNDPDEILRKPSRGEYQALSRPLHGAIFSLAIDELRRLDQSDAQLDQYRLKILSTLYKRHGVQQLVDKRLQTTRRHDLSRVQMD